MSHPEETPTPVEAPWFYIRMFNWMAEKTKKGYAWIFPEKILISDNESGEILRRALSSKSWFDKLSSGWVEQPFWVKLLVISVVVLLSIGVGLLAGIPYVLAPIALTLLVIMHVLFVAHEHNRVEKAKILAAEAVAIIKDLEAIKPLLEKGVTVVHQVAEELGAHSAQMKENAEVLEKETEVLTEQSELLSERVDEISEATTSLVVIEKEVHQVLEQTVEHIVTLDAAIVKTTEHVEGVGAAAEQFSEAVEAIQQSQITYSDAITRFGLFVADEIARTEQQMQLPPHQPKQDDEAFYRALEATNAELDDDERLMEQMKAQYGL